MITVLSYVRYDSNYSSKEDNFDEAVSEEGILTVTEDINAAFARVAKDQADYPEEETEYLFNFWLDGEVYAHALVCAPIETVKQQVLDHIKSYMH